MSHTASWCWRTLAFLTFLRVPTVLAQEPESTASQPTTTPGPVASPPGAGPVSAATSFDDLEAVIAEAPGATTPVTPTAPGPEGARLTASALNPSISLILDVAFAHFSDDDPLQSGHHDPKESGFNWQGLELALSNTVDPYLRLDANIGFSLEGVEIEEAYGTTMALPGGFQARFGKFFSRFGRTNATHLHTWNFADQPFALGRVFGGHAGGLGAEFSVALPTPWSVELVASATKFAGDHSHEEEEHLHEEEEDEAVHEEEPEFPEDLLATLALKQFFALSNDWSLSIGLSSQFGPYAWDEDRGTEIYGADLYVKYRPLSVPEPRVVSLHSEWVWRRRRVDGQFLQDYGEFTEIFWRFSRRWATAARYELGSPSFDGSRRIQIDPANPEWTRTRHRVSASLSFYPTEFSRFRWQWGEDIPQFRDPIWSTFLTAEVAVGAHGAHEF